jgi:anti-sigma factor RsiW
MKFFNSHLSAEQIADAIDNRLPQTEQSELNAHLASCGHCTAEFSALRKAIGLMRKDDSADAPLEAVSFAMSLFRTRKQFAPRESVTQRILATLKFELSPFAPAFGERSASVSAERQMFFEAAGFDLDLRIRAAENGFNLVGQVLGELAAQNSIRLQNAEFNREEQIRELGEFSFSNVPAGNFDLYLRIGETEIVINDLTLE